MSSSSGHTEILRESESVLNAMTKFFTNAKARMDMCAVIAFLGRFEGVQEVREAYLEAGRRGVKLRFLTEVNKDNAATCEELMDAGMNLRHLVGGSRGNFGVSDTEYLTTPGAEEFNHAAAIVYSNEEAFVKNNQAVFDMLWDNAISAKERIAEIDEGIAPGRIEVIHDPAKVQQMLMDLIRHAKEEILVLLPTSSDFNRHKKIGTIDSLRIAGSERRVRVSILAPDSLVKRTLQAFDEQDEARVGRKLIYSSSIAEATTPTPVSFFVVDRKASIIIELKDDSQLDFADAIGVATYSTVSPTVRANVRFFETMWEETELRENENVVLERERRSRRAAELLQDVMSHDIKNYNQIVMLNAEMLRDAAAMTSAEEKASEIDAILKAIDGSSKLIERARKLGKIMSQAEIELHPVDLERSLQTSVVLIMKAHPRRSINLSSLSVKPGAQVVADDLLEEVFTNILSNSVNYTERDEVPVEIQTEEVVLDEKSEGGGSTSYWKVIFTDHGKGIPDSVKERIFTRYLSTASGSGLGLSIVHALVVERYSGKIIITDRVEGDHTKGTKVEIWLQKAPSQL